MFIALELVIVCVVRLFISGTNESKQKYRQNIYHAYYDKCHNNI